MPDHNPSSSAENDLQRRMLMLFGGDKAACQKWLHTPDPALGNACPQELIDRGESSKVRQVVEKALEGIPD